MVSQSTHTYAILDVSASAFDEIKALLSAAGYEHAFHDDVIDMQGIAIRAKGEPRDDLDRLAALVSKERHEFGWSPESDAEIVEILQRAGKDVSP